MTEFDPRLLDDVADTVLAGILRRFLTDDDAYADVRRYRPGAGGELVLDGWVTLSEAECAALGRPDPDRVAEAPKVSSRPPVPVADWSTDEPVRPDPPA